MPRTRVGYCVRLARGSPTTRDLCTFRQNTAARPSADIGRSPRCRSFESCTKFDYCVGGRGRGRPARMRQAAAWCWCSETAGPDTGRPFGSRARRAPSRCQWPRTDHLVRLVRYGQLSDQLLELAGRQTQTLRANGLSPASSGPRVQRKRWHGGPGSVRPPRRTGPPYV